MLNVLDMYLNAFNVRGCVLSIGSSFVLVVHSFYMHVQVHRLKTGHDSTFGVKSPVKRRSKQFQKCLSLLLTIQGSLLDLDTCN